MSNNDFSFRLFNLMHGGAIGSDPMQIATIPNRVMWLLRWRTDRVFITNRDAQKMRHHPKHGMDATRAMLLPTVISSGDYYQTNHRGSALQIEVVLHEPDAPKRAYFLVLSRNREDTGIFLRTFYFTGQLSRRKMRKARCLLDQNSIKFFGD